jgi:hypothetical protein
MVWLIAWLLMLFTAVSTVSSSGTEVAIPVEPDHGTGSGAAPIFLEPDCDLDVAMPGGTSSGSAASEPAIQPIAPGTVTVEPELADPGAECGQVLPPDTVVVSPPADGDVTPPGPAHPPIEPGLPDIDGDRVLTPAPIEDLGLMVLKSYPAQYVLRVTSALPDGCSQFAGYTVERDGTTITIEVWNSVPTGLVPCTMQYGYHPFSVELGSDFESGQEYTVVVGERELSFVAQ